MRSVTMNSGVQTQAPNRHKAARHFANGAVVAGGLAGIGYGHFKIIPGIYKGLPVPKSISKIGNFFIKLGEKMFPKNSDISRIMESYASGCKDVGKAVRHYKGQWALSAVGIAGALALIGAGIYKAGKINGEGN